MKRILAPLVLTLALIPASAASAYVNPVNQTPPTIEGTPQVGSTLKINPGTWTPTPTSYTYSWERCTSTGTECNYLEPYVNTNTYVPTTADVGHKMRALVVAWNGPVFGNTWTAPVGPVTEKEAEPTVFVNKAPTGPPEPAGGWSVSYADDFTRTIGTAAEQDNTFRPEENNQGCCGNANEIAYERPSQISVGPEGLKIKCEANAPEVNGHTYLCGGVRGKNEGSWAGPIINITGGSTLVFEMKGTLPPNLGTADPGWWMNGPPYGNAEFDFPEFYGANSPYAKDGWAKTPDYFHWFVGTEPTLWGTSIKPEIGVHTWTTEVRPGNVSGKYVVQVWLDGSPLKLRDETESCYSSSCEKEVSREVTPIFTEDHLILTYGLRKPDSGLNEFTSGSNYFTVRSVAVYEDNSHKGVGITHGGLAPGTIVK